MTMWLIGMMGSGKTTIGSLAAKVLDVPFLDTDEMVADSAGMSIADIWSLRGEAVFRAMEREAIASVAGVDGIVAVGGGAVVSEENRLRIGDSGAVIWLTCPPAELASRLGDDASRPLLGDDPAAALNEILEMRRELYAALASHQVETAGRDPDEVVSEIVSLWTA